MAQTVSVKDTRSKLAEIIDRVAIGEETFVITKFGKPRAMIVPFANPVNFSTSLDEVFGAWKDRKDIKNTSEWVRKLRIASSFRKKDE